MDKEYKEERVFRKYSEEHCRLRDEFLGVNESLAVSAIGDEGNQE